MADCLRPRDRPVSLNERFVRLQNLVKAIRKGNLTQAHELISVGVNVNCTAGGVTPLHVAAAHDHVECAEFLLQNGSKVNQTIADFTTPLHVAARFDSLACVALFLTHDAEVNAMTRDGLSPLHLAARNGNVKTAEILIARGAEVDFASKPHPRARSQGDNLCPLHFAARHNQPDCIEIIAKFGGNLNIQSGKSEMTALHLAVRNKHLACSAILVSHGANINLADFKGNTPLHYAAAVNDTDVTELLLQTGADLDHFNNAGKKPVDIAEGDLKAILEPLRAQPKCLMYLCVQSVRGSLFLAHGSRKTLDDVVSFLPLPKKVKDKLTLKEEIDIV